MTIQYEASPRFAVETQAESLHMQGIKSVAVAVRSGNLLATAFHPELTDDPRW